MQLNIHDQTEMRELRLELEKLHQKCNELEKANGDLTSKTELLLAKNRKLERDLGWRNNRDDLSTGTTLSEVSSDKAAFANVGRNAVYTKESEESLTGVSSGEPPKKFCKDVPRDPSATWDFSLQALESKMMMWMEGPLYQKMVGECLHETHNLFCECAEQKKIPVCRLCHAVFCSNHCFKETIKRQTTS